MTPRHKTPQQKKRESYLRDRRNTYGENPEASRKGIARKKRLGARLERRSVRQILAEAAEGRVPERTDAGVDRVIARRRGGVWKKWPDEPLATVLMRQLLRRVRLGLLTPEAAERKAERIRRLTNLPPTNPRKIR